MNRFVNLAPLVTASVLGLACLGGGAALAETAEESWLDEYLAAELGYSPEQVDEFKANVAPLPRSEMVRLVEQLKFAAGRADAGQEQRLWAHERNLERLQTAESLARARPSRVAPQYVSGPFSSIPPRPRVQPVHRTGLFRGYVGWIRVP